MITFKWNDFDFTLVHFGKGVFNEDMAGHSHTKKNIYELHYIIDGKDTITTDTTIGIIDEMLLYSNDGVIEVLPALPDEWDNGNIEGLRARTNAEVVLKWTTENVTLPTTIDKDQTIKVSVYGGEEQNVSFNKGETKTIVLAR